MGYLLTGLLLLLTSTLTDQQSMSTNHFATESTNLTMINGEFNTTYNLTVSGTQSAIMHYTYIYNNWTDHGMRIHVDSSHANKSYPVMVVLKQQLGILSWQIPLFADNKFGYSSVGRTLCPIQDYFDSTRISPNQSIFVDLSTASPDPVAVTLSLDTEDDFYIGVNEPITVLSSPSQPLYFEVNFPDDINHLLVKVTSPDSICAVVSIQDARCPVFDLDRNVQFNGTYQTMTTRSAIATTRNMYSNGFFIVLIVKSTDDTCVLNPQTNQREANGQNQNDLRKKNFTIEVVTTVSEVEYWIATFGIIGVFLLFYVFAIIVAIIYCFRRNTEEYLLFHVEVCNNLSFQDYRGDNTNYGTITPSISSFNASHASTSEQSPLLRDREIPVSDAPLPIPAEARCSPCHDSDSDSSLDETEIDLLRDADSDKEIVRTKTFLYVSDLARKKCRTLSKRSQMYSWNVATIAILYALPVIQLVLTYQKAIKSSGDQDICFYNFLCAHPRGYFSDFNHVYSNIGYIMLGFLFLSLVWRRDLMHKKLLELNSNVEKLYGIPHHFGLFYAMSVALMMEGLLSACYHVCPNYTNFQFDASFMYMIAGLCMLKIYQTRHPDINADAYGASLAFAVVILTAVLGVLFGNIYFWVLFTIVHIMACVALSAQIYYMGRWNLNLGIFKRLYLQWKNDFLSSNLCVRPMYMDRMCLLLLANLTNWSIAIFGILQQPRDFASYLLSIFMVNLVLYLAFYIIMKVRHGERFLFLPKLYIVLSTVAWGASLYFFLARKSISWELTPALSREKNRACVLLDFYDDHDIWHFLSATSMFFSFMILLTMDDDLIFTRRCKIPVF